MADQNGTLLLNFFNVYGDRIKDHADIMLAHQVLSDRRVVRNVNTSKRIKIPNLNAVPQGLYRLEVDPLGYMPVSRFVNVESGDGTEVDLTFAVNPTKVSAVQFPEYATLPERVQALLQASNNVPGFPNKAGAELYAALDDTRKAGFLNIVAKCAHTALVSSMAVIEYLQQLNECRGDRFFARMTQQLREDTKNSVANGHFFEAPELLHHPPVGFESAKSFKTDDHNQFTVPYHNPGVSTAPGALSGIARNAIDCTPAAGVTVTYSGGSAVTDANGNFAIPAAARKSQAITASKSGWLSDARFGTSTPNAIAEPSPVKIFLSTAGQIKGHVLNGFGMPVAGASVTITGGKLRLGKTVVSDASGSYSSGWIAIGGYTVSVTAPGAVGATVAATVNTGLVTPLDLTVQ
jgi:hypothetical protein